MNLREYQGDTISDNNATDLGFNSNLYFNLTSLFKKAPQEEDGGAHSLSSHTDEIYC